MTGYKRMQYLMDRYYTNTASDKEIDELFILLRDNVQDEEAELLLKQLAENTMPDQEYRASYWQPIIQKILYVEAQPEQPGMHRSYVWKKWLVAASVLVILTAAIFTLVFKPVKQPSPSPVSRVIETSDYTRNLTLPDGTTITLRANSTVAIMQGFNVANREVTLNGEAYFDVAKATKNPFIIHTGKLKTTVLGTAFNIKAYQDQKEVIVSVERGEVRVENGGKVLALLTKNQQVIYETPDNIELRQTVNVNQIVEDWAGQDMIFEGSSFEHVAEIISKHYSISINFKNDELRNCSVKVAFKGTEPLQKILEVLALIGNITYEEIEKGVYLIDGKGCDEMTQ